MVSFTLSSALAMALAVVATAAPARRSLPTGDNVYLALLTSNGSLPLYLTKSSAGEFDLVFRPGTYFDGTPAIVVNGSSIVFDIGDDLPYGLTQPEFRQASGSKVDIPDPVTALPGTGTSGLRVYSGILQPEADADVSSHNLWAVCRNGDERTFEFVIEGPGALPSGCNPATIQVYTRI